MKIIIGQEAICPKGLGRIVKILPSQDFLIAKVIVNTYIGNNFSVWGLDKVELIPINGREDPCEEQFNTKLQFIINELMSTFPKEVIEEFNKHYSDKSQIEQLSIITQKIKGYI